MIIITGMHCSGTSAIAGVLYRGGLPYDGDPINDRSEDYETMMFNDQLISYCKEGATWMEPPPIEDVMRTALDPNIFKDPTFMRYERGFKDPRAALILPIWQHNFPKLKVIWIRRKTENTIASYEQRDKVDTETAAKLLTEYNKHILIYLKKCKIPYLTIWFEDFIKDPIKEIMKIEKFTGFKIDLKGLEFFDKRKVKHND